MPGFFKVSASIDYNNNTIVLITTKHFESGVIHRFRPSCIDIGSVYEILIWLL